MKKAHADMFCAVVLAAYCLSLGQQLSPQVMDKVKSATVYIQAVHRFALNDEEITTTGTGFFAGKCGLVATNYHVVQPVIPIYEVQYPAPIKELRVIKNSGSPQYKVFKGTVVAVDRENDLALIATGDTAGGPVLNIREPSRPVETTPVWVFGFPFGEEFAVVQRGPEVTVCKGGVSALRHDDKRTLTSIQIDAPVNPGNSGGPVIDQKGAVVGVVRVTYGPATNVNLAAPVHYLAALADSPAAGACGGDSAFADIASAPQGAFVCIDGRPAGITPQKHIALMSGMHTLCLVKKGYEAWLEQISIPAHGQRIAASLPAVRDLMLTVAAGKGAEADRESVQDPSWKAAVRGAPLPQMVLFKEDFDSAAAFEKWEQATGGTAKRTWFIEEGALHQHEADELLHAIYMGDTAWRDYGVTVRVKIPGKRNDSRAGVIVRESPDGFYLFRIHKESCKAQLAYHCKRPFGWFILREKKLPKLNEAWYRITVVAAGRNIVCMLDTMCVFAEKADLGFRGRAGLYSVESRPSFDSLTVFSVPPLSGTAGQATGSEVRSFWFTDNFDLKSTWWYQYTSGGETSPWLFSEAGLCQLQDDTPRRFCEFTRYRFSDFNMNCIVSLGKPDSSSSEFGIFFRKNADGYAALLFSQKDRKVRLVKSRPNGMETLRDAPLPDRFFENTRMMEISLNGQECIMRTSEGTIASFKSGRLLQNHGRMGFFTAGTRVILHRMTVSSVQNESGGRLLERKAPVQKKRLWPW